jgi:hypothetical protein
MFEQIVPKEYHKYSKVFSEIDSHYLPQHRPWDHAIDLKLNALETLKSKVYPIPHNKQGALNKFIEEQLAKGYIVPSKSPMALLIFFVKKKNGELQLIQNYWKLNDDAPCITQTWKLELNLREHQKKQTQRLGLEMHRQLKLYEKTIESHQ